MNNVRSVQIMELLLIILVPLLSLGGVIVYKIYEEKYYRSLEFNELKEELENIK